MITQENIPYTADEIKAMVKTCEKYNKVLERAREQYNKRVPLYDIESIFPELKESEDEKIRKTLIEYIKGIKSWNYFLGISKGQMIAWLEKQGEQKHFSDFKAKDWYVSKVDGKIYNMTYNPNDKVEPKFKIGNWITDGRLTCKVLSVTGKSYELHLHNDDYCHFETDIQSVNKYYHLWTIQDANAGDVLLEEETGEPFIYNGIRATSFSSYVLGAYCGVYNGEFNPYGNIRHWGKNSCPATKEQRDLLFRKMEEAGYEWDSEKKELKKVEPKNPIVNVPPRELILSIWDLGNEWKELTNGSSSTEYGTQLEYIQKHWQESSYYDNIGDNIPTLTSKDYDKLFINCKH